ncbi:helix-turn-helix domain-containing protein [Desulfosediminicola flagellatus]|uniref:helix-turn-helix domain-containing protein n=1 Tax=Desulfosediminicola flagellatus TaxID=2569541 RepID=UPI0010ACECBC|nr:helix-turn-helix domain-containing protein [Desulfosediminicola flagellatus]
MGWKKTRLAAEHFGVSERTMRTMLKEGFPHVKLPSGTILINSNDGDEYLRNNFSVDHDKDDQAIFNAIKDL